jgi:hypothetical protein
MGQLHPPTSRRSTSHIDKLYGGQKCGRRLEGVAQWGSVLVSPGAIQVPAFGSGCTILVRDHDAHGIMIRDDQLRGKP